MEWEITCIAVRDRLRVRRARSLSAQTAQAARSSFVRYTRRILSIAEADFFAQDLKLYLDTHPDDKRAVEMYAEACRQYMACKAAFEDSFYPLTASSAGRDGCWDWPEGVWAPFK